ncbi:MAG: glutamate ABC transporter substrate-binding protein [Beutenbergiaceae bacterium]
MKHLRSSRSRRPWAVLALTVALVGGLGACNLDTGLDDLGGESPEPTETDDGGSGSGPTTTVTCDDPVQSYEPTEALPSPGVMPAGSTMATIAERGSLIVGVSADTLLMGSRNPFTGEIEGFDIDILREVSRAIFGDPDRLQFRVITSAQRIEVLTAGEVDVVARAFTITCARWEEIAFSAEYYHSGQKVLVAAGSPVLGLDDLAGNRVCAPAGTTTLARLGDYPEVTAVPAPTHSQCLALFQQGKVDAITGDDTILAGFAAQDPYAQVVGDPISDEPYGLGIPPENRDMVRFVNGVLEQIVADGTWTEIYDRWLDGLGPAPTPPVPVYGR